MRRVRLSIPKSMLVTATFVVTMATAGSSWSLDGIEGHWEGAFTRLGAVQQVSFDFATTDSGLVGTYDIPDMILYREPVRELAVSGDTVHLRVFWGRFTCVLNRDLGEMTGGNPKWGPPVSLHLKTAMPSRHFRIEPVQFTSGAVQLSGDLLLPAGNPPFPAVVVIEGSSNEGRSLWTYRSIGDLYARNGIAALIYDKRGSGASQGDIATATLDDLTGDAVAAVQFLQLRPDIDGASIGLFGISQGGWIAPRVAVLIADVAFAALLAGPAVSVWEQELDRVEYSMRAGINGEDEPDHFSDADIQAALAHTALGFAVAQDPNRWSEWQASVDAARGSLWAGYVGLDSTIEDLQGWLQYRYDPAETLQNLRTPLLALFGGDDVLVPPANNVPLMRKLLSKAGNETAEIVVFPGVGHDFLTGATLVGNAWEWPTGYWRWNRRVPGLVDTIITWSLRQVQR